MKTKTKFISGEEAFFDDEKGLYYCYVGISDANMTLHYLAYGETSQLALTKAKKLAYLLNMIDGELSSKARLREN